MTQADHAIAILNSIGDAVLTTDVSGRITYLNLRAEYMTGWSREAAAGRPLGDVFHVIDRDTREVAQDPLRLALQLDKTVSLAPNSILLRRDGVESQIEDSAAPIRDDDGLVIGAVIVFRDVGVALENSRRMSHLAEHDALTGLPNGLLLHDRLNKALALGQRRKKPVAVIFLDLDGFKDINDSLGHAAGDSILRSVATRLTAALRLSDTVSRRSGDEFVIVLPEVERAEDAGAVAGKLLVAASAPYWVGAHEVGLTASIGVAVYPDHGENADALITNADAAMYRAKRSGPGHYEVVSPPPA